MTESTIWTEKYRPQKFEDIKGQTKIVERIKAFVEQKNMPHVLLAGPAGVGKSTIALVIAKELYKETWKNNFLELNASVTGDTPILIKQNNSIKRTNFNELAQKYFKDNKETSRINTEDLEIFSLDKNTLKTKFSKVNYIFRHKVKKIAKIKYEGGFIKTSLNHSIIILDKNGDLKEKKCEDLKKGDLIISFVTELPGTKIKLDLREHKIQTHNQLVSGLILNPKVKQIFEEIELTNNLSWALGLYTAEGCTSLKNNSTSGQMIYALGYPQEMHLISKLKEIFTPLQIPHAESLGKSGFDRTKESSIQLRLFNTQLVKYLRANCYNSDRKIAKTKRIFSALFNAELQQKIAFLKGYIEGDGCGKWEKVSRVSSRSKDCLIDTVWLSKISGIESSYFDSEARLIWNNKDFTYIKSNLLPANIFTNLIEKNLLNKNNNPRYTLRHQLYSKKSNRIKRDIAKKILENLSDQKLKGKFTNLINSEIHSLRITKIDFEEIDDYVYDVSVPESQMFFGGTNPILLHNSDDRGIDVVRNTIKEFAKTKGMGEIPFKIIFLDECDSLTKEAQQALRRTMENYVTSTRFLLSCNYSSKIIDPIQSRCTVFRFKPLTKEEIEDYILKIASTEKLNIDKKAIAALVDISNGDVRKITNILQSTSVIDKNITEDLIYSLVSAAEPKEIQEILKLAINKRFIQARGLLLDTMLKHGLSGLDILKQIQKETMDLDAISDEKRVELLDKCGEIEFRMTEGSDEFIQLEALLAYFAK
jgi:replication factor C small subunit